MYEKLVTICTPCYNHAKYLDDYFKSIINQTYKKIELVIIDDCSKDDSARIIQEYIPQLKLRFERVVFIINEKNLGITKNCNKMLKESNGYFVKPMASDDILLDNGIEMLVDFMEKNEKALLGIGNVCKVLNSYRYGDVYQEEKMLNTEYLSSLDDIFNRLLLGNFIVAVGLIYRREIFSKYGYYDPNMMYEDWDYLLTVTKHEKLYFCDEVVCLYRQSDTSYGAYMRCKNGKEQELKFARMYYGGIKVLEKHTKGMESEKGAKIIKNHMVVYLYRAIEYKIPKFENIILKELKERKFKLSNKEKLRCFWLKYFFQFYKILVKAKRKIFY